MTPQTASLPERATMVRCPFCQAEPAMLCMARGTAKLCGYIHMARIRAFHRLRRVLAKQLVLPGLETS